MKLNMESFYCFAFYWFFSIYPFATLMNSFGYLDVWYIYLFNAAFSLIIYFSFFVDKSPQKLRLDFLLSSLFFLLCFLILYVGGKDIYGSLENGMNQSVFSYFTPFIINSMGMYVLGYNLSINNVIESKLKYILLLPCVFIFINTNDFRLDYSLLVDQSMIGVYLLVGDVLCVTVFFFIFGFKSFFKRFFFFFLFLFALYLNNSRAAFFVLLLSLGIYLYIYMVIRNNYILVMLTTLFLFVLYVFSDYILPLISLNERMGAVFSGNDYSINERSILLEQGVRAILNNWVVGDIGGQIFYSGRLGGYIHNLLEYWRQFGLLCFLILLYMIGYAVKCLILKLHFRLNDNQDFIAIGVGIVSIILIFTSRSIPYSILFFAIGMLSSNKTGRKLSHE